MMIFHDPFEEPGLRGRDPDRAVERFLVLGAGGAGAGGGWLCVQAVKQLREEFIFPPGVSVVDTAGAGLSFLLALLGAADQAVVIVSVWSDSKPGSIFMFNSDEIDTLPKSSFILHDETLSRALKTAESRGTCPPVTIVGVQSGSDDPRNEAMSKKMRLCLTRICNIAVDLMIDAGLTPERRLRLAVG